MINTKQIIIASLLVVFAIGLFVVPQAVAVPAITVSVDKASYLPGEVIQISGSCPGCGNSIDVVFISMYPVFSDPRIFGFNDDWVFMMNMPVDSSGSFSTTYHGTARLDFGVYVVQASAGHLEGFSNWDDFSIVENPNTVTNALGSSTPGCEDTNACFIPNPVTISVGETVTWENTDNAAHTVTSGSPADGPDGVFDSSMIMAGGASFSHTFDAAGTYDYFCMVHPWMAGSVIVEGEESTDSADSSTLTFSVSTDKSTYFLGQTVQVSGTGDENKDVTILVKSSAGDYVFVGQVESSTSGSFSWSFVTGNLNLGTYTITANQGPVPAEITISIVDNPNTIYNALGSSTPGCEDTNSCFVPSTMTIGVGETVTWENVDNAAHTATSGTPADGSDGVFDSSLIMAGGASFSHTFDAAGTGP